MCAAWTPPLPNECPVPMHDGEPCRRPIHRGPTGIDKAPVCLMHSRDLHKDPEEFTKEIQAIISSSSKYKHAANDHDFTRFVFLEVDFRKASFFGNAYFLESTFTQRADFSEVKFFGHTGFWKATFAEDADFWGASFGSPPQSPEAAQNMPLKVADFQETTFGGDANFAGAIFGQRADFSQAVFGPRLGQLAGSDASQKHAAIADFRAVRFDKPENVRFYRVNKDSSQGLLLRLVDCEIEGVHFQDVNWHRQRGRMVLQDELDITAGHNKGLNSGAETVSEVRHELVAIAYRRMISNFERVRAYDVAEDCFVGAMEMRRRDPRYSYLARQKQVLKFYLRHTGATWLIQQFSLTNLYRVLSNYGSSYKRALAWLLAFLLLFAVVFPCFGLRMRDLRHSRGEVAETAASSTLTDTFSWQAAWRHPARGRELLRTAEAGFWTAVEVATFAKSPTMEPASNSGRKLAVAEVIVIPGQLALFFLALRRRFRR